MKPIREQLREQAVAIRDGWAKGPSPDGWPRIETITLVLESPVMPTRAIRDYVGRVNSDMAYAPEGCLLLRGGKIERTATRESNGDIAFVQRVTVNVDYRDYPWNYRVSVVAATHFPPGPPKILIDRLCPPAYQSADFDEWLDALEPPCGGTSSAPDDPSSEPGSWLDRPSLL